MVLLLTAVAVGAWTALSHSTYGRTAGLLLRASRMTMPALAPVTRWQTSDVTTRDEPLPSRRGPLRARHYTPTIVRTRPLLVLSGVHALGIDEPRLRHFAMEIARSGTPVVTPELPDLQSYLITGQLTDDIEDAAVALANATAAARGPHADARIGLLGVSFSGGLAIVAAGRSSLRDRVAFVFSFGGHANLPRVLRYLATGLQPDGTRLTPHDYGGVVLLMNAAPLLVPAAQVPALRASLTRFLHASHVAMFDRAQADREFAEAVEMEDALPDASRHLLHLVNTRNSGELGRLLLPHVNAAAVDPSLSPELSPAPLAPVFILHAEQDTIIPTSEAAALQQSLGARGTPVRLLTTNLLSHADVRRRPSVGEIVDLVRFWAEMPWTPR